LFLALDDDKETRGFGDIITSMSYEEMRDLDIAELEKKWRESFAKNRPGILSLLQKARESNGEDVVKELDQYNKF
jgi:hypothetical protein